MNAKIDTSLIKAQRLKRAWSQEQLALVAGLGLRTVHRIEKSGQCSLESLKSLASVFELLPDDLMLQPKTVEKVVFEAANKGLGSIVRSIRKFVTGGIVGAFLASLSFIAADTVFAAQVDVNSNIAENAVFASCAFIDEKDNGVLVELDSGQ